MCPYRTKDTSTPLLKKQNVRNFCICGFHREYIDVSAELLGVNIRVSSCLRGAPCIVVMSEISARDNHFGAGHSSLYQICQNWEKF